MLFLQMIALGLLAVVSASVVPRQQRKIMNMTLHLGGHCDLCVTTIGDSVTLQKCGVPLGGSQHFVAYESGVTTIQLPNTGRCLGTVWDGVNPWVPYDGVRLVVTDCPTAPTPLEYRTGNTIWEWRDAHHLELKGQKLCLDNYNGNAVTSNPLQVWTCYGDNNNQWWSAIDWS